MSPTYLPYDALTPGWVLTVNFAQGKEYDTVDFVLPKLDSSGHKMVHSTFALFDRSHIHVAMTRHKTKFTLLGDPDAMQEIAARNNEALTTRFTFLRYWLALIEEHRSSHFSPSLLK